MYARLGLIALSGFALSAICLGGAFALGGGNAVEGAVFNFGGFGMPVCPAAPPSAASSRTLPWDGGGDRVAVAFAANSYYRPGNGDQLVVKGDPRIISHVTVRGGVVSLDCNPGGFFFGQRQRIEVTLPGRQFRSFEQQGSGNMQLSRPFSGRSANFDQRFGRYSGRWQSRSSDASGRWFWRFDGFRHDGRSQFGYQGLRQRRAGRSDHQERRCEN